MLVADGGMVLGHRGKEKGRQDVCTERHPPPPPRLPESSQWLHGPEDMPCFVPGFYFQNKALTSSMKWPLHAPTPTLVFHLLPQLSWAPGTWIPFLGEGSILGNRSYLGTIRENKTQALGSDRTEWGRHKIAKFYAFRCTKITDLHFSIIHLFLSWHSHR